MVRQQFPSKFVFSDEKTGVSDAVTAAYLCADLNAVVCPTQSNFAHSYNSAPSDAAREAVTKCAAKNGFTLSVATASPAVGIKPGM